MNAGERRALALEELAARTFDLLVVGAGITGARVALDAASAGLKVALVDRADIASGASSASSKFVHGGLRYLTMGNLRLVRAAQLERASLLRALPELVRPMPIMLALDRRRFPRPLVDAGLHTYTALAGGCGDGARRIAAADATALVPSVSLGRNDIAVLLPEAQTDDARLTLATARAAAARGAVVANYVAVDGFERSSRGVVGAAATDVHGGNRLEIRFRAVVNAAGAHVDAVRRLEDPASTPIARLSKGVHVVLPLEGRWGAGIASYSAHARTTFAVPWSGMLLVGATDTAHEGTPEEARADAADIARLLDAAARFLPPDLLRPERVRSTFVGLRVLPAAAGDTAAIPRHHIVSVGRGGMVSVAGGKLTLHRLIARDALAALPPDVRPRQSRWDGRLWSAARACLSPATELREQLSYAIEHEWAVTVEDLVRRRTTLELQGLADDRVRSELARMLERAGVGRGARSEAAA